MPFYTYSLAPFLSSSPKTQILNELTSKLSEHWARTKEHVVLLSNVTLQGKLMDAVLVKQSAVCVFSFLDCGGRIEAQKTGMWKAGGKPIKGINPYKQLDTQTKVVALELSKIKAVKEIQGIALFRNPIVFNDKASPISDIWFHVSDIESLSRKFFEKHGGLLKRPELETVLIKLGVDPALILGTSAAPSETTRLNSKPAALGKNAGQLSTEEIDRLLGSAQSHIDNIRYFTAVQDLDKVIKYDSSNYRALFLRGLANYNLSQFNEAVQDYDRAIANGFTNDSVYFKRALALIKLGNETKALLDLGEAIKLNRHNKLYYQKRGEYLFSSGLYKLAINDFNSYINLKGDDATPYFYRGCCYEKIEEYGDAKADFEMALRLSPNSHQAFKALLRVKKQLKRGINEIPADVFSHTIERTNATSLNLLPTPPKQAEEDKPTNIQSRLKTPEEQAMLLYHKGLENQQKSLHFEGLTDYNKAISLDPTNPTLYNQRGLCWLEVENEDRALADFSKALSLAPDYREARQYIEKINSSRAQQEYTKAISLEKAGDYQGAITCYDKAIGLAPNKKAYFYKRGTAKRATGDLHGALHDFDTAIKLDSLFAKAYNDRGNVWQKLGNLEKAVNDYKQAVQLEPSFTIASNNLNYGVFLLEG